MADYLFVPQSVLDRWSEQGRISVDGTILTILGENRSFVLASAVRFMKMEEGEDAAGLLHKVKTTDALKAMGAEHYRESVLLGETAYEVQEGFLADAHALRRAAAVSSAKAKVERAPDAQGSGADGKTKDKPEGEQELLAQYLLDNL